MLENETHTETAQAAPRPRRGASRPAGPPKQIEPVKTAAQPVLEAPAVIAPLPALESPSSGSEAPPETKRPVRRRRSTKAASPAEPVAEEIPSPGEAAPATEVSVSPGDSKPETVTETKRPVRRRRSTKAAAPPEPASEAAVEIAETEPVAPETAPEPARESKPKRVRRRTTKEEAVAEAPPEPSAEAAPPDEAADPLPLDESPKDADAPESAEDGSSDELAEALAAIKVTAREQTETPADETDRDAILSSLVEAIASGEAEAPEETAEEPDPEDAEDAPKRRRRRGGRRRRRSSRGDDESGAEDEADGPTPESEDSDNEDADGEEVKTTRRRRRRRRRGEDASGDDEPGTDVVVKVREPRRSSTDSDQVTGIEGSTRLEAKRQRRKESRAAGRRRAPILSEAEFLARRESVDRKLVIRQGEDYTQLAVLEDSVLVEHYVDRASATSLIGNIYLGKVQNVLPSMEAAFIDIGRGRNAVLYAGEIDWDGLGHTGERKVEEVFKSGQSVLVQVTKDPIGAKGARLTSHISLPGRYIVYSPGGHLSGISRKLPDIERSRLKEILSSLIGNEASVIVRTAAEGVSEEELVRDVNRLKTQWEIIEKKSRQGSAPQQLYAEPDLTLRIVRDLFTEDFNEMIIQGDGSAEDAFDAISAYVTHVAPHLADRVRRYEPVQGSDCFTNFRIDEQIAKALERKVFLPSGGSLIIDRTEAMTVIDVNTGKFTGTGGNLEATVTSNNLEASEEIVRQLRLRDIGGIIVIDFIDMVLPSNRELLLRRLVECLGRDRTRHQVAEVTSLGLVQLTRKKIGTGLAEAFTEQCECCGGRGYHRFDEPVDSQAPADGGERQSRRRRRNGNG